MTPVAAVAVDHAPLLERAFARPPREVSGEAARVEGTVPGFIRGTLYLNGPARFARGGQAFGHWLDGDGMVAALRFAGGAPLLTSRYVATARLAEETAAGRALYRSFGTAFSGDRLLRGVALPSPANVSVLPWGGRLLASGEQGLPYELDPETLETRGEHTFGGRLNPVSPLAAHPKVDPATGELFHFGVSFSATQPALTLYRFGAGGDLLCRRRLALERASSVHDFALAGRHAVFHLSPYVLDMGAFLEGGRSLLDALAWRPELGSRLLVAAREDGAEVASVPIGRGYCLHLINAFEEGEDRLVVDVVELDRPVYDQYLLPDLFADEPAGRPVRLVVDLARGELAGRREVDYASTPDFPAIDPDRLGRPYRDAWMLGLSAAGRPGRKFFDQVARVDWEEAGPPRDLWQAPPLSYLAGEPAFVADPASDRAGALLCPLFDAEREESAVLVFDAFDLAAGPLARLTLPAPLHLAFHAAFAPAE